MHNSPLETRQAFPNCRRRSSPGLSPAQLATERAAKPLYLTERGTGMRPLSPAMVGGRRRMLRSICRDEAIMRRGGRRAVKCVYSHHTILRAARPPARGDGWMRGCGGAVAAAGRRSHTESINENGRTKIALKRTALA